MAMHRCKGLGVLVARRFLLLVLVSHAILASAQTSIGTPFPIATNWAAAGGAFDGTNYLVTLVTNAQTANVAAQLISQTGAKVGPLIAVGRSGQTCCVAVAFDGTNYLMVWEDDQGIKNRPDPFMGYGQFISTTGVALGQPFAITNAGVWIDGHQFLAYGGGKYLITYTRLIVPANGDSSTNRYIAGRIISPDGTMGSELRISSGFGAKSSIGFDGTNFFVTWIEDSLDHEVRGRFVSPTGTPGQEISVNASPAPSDNPSVIGFDGTNYLVVFHDEAAATLTLASIAGTWVVSSTNDTYAFPIGSVFTVDASGNYTTSVPGCTHTGTLSVSGTTFAMTVLTSTGCTAPGTTITGTMEVTANTVKATVGSSWSLSQRTAGQGTATAWDVLGQRVSPAGALVGGVITVSNDPGPQLGMGIAFDGTNYLISWTDMQSSTNWDVYGRYVGRDGALVGDRFAINTDAGNQMGGIGAYANGKYFGVVNSGVQFGANGPPTQVGDASGLFLSPYQPTQPSPSPAVTPPPPADPTQPVAPPPPTQSSYTVPTGRMPEAAVTTTASGTLGSVTLTVSLDLSQVLSAPSFAGQGQFAAGYNVYVLALVPGAALGLSAPAWFVLPATRVWAALSFPIAAFLQGAASQVVQIPILESLNMTSLLGTEFYVGYGTDEFEMLAAGRYRGVYKVQ